MTILKFYPEHGVGECIDHYAFHFYGIFFCHLGFYLVITKTLLLQIQL